MKKRIWSIICVLAVFTTLSGFTEPEPEYDGWIFEARPYARIASAEERSGGMAEPVWGHVYRTADEGLLEELRDDGLLVYVEPDYRVELEWMPDDPYLKDGAQYSSSMLGLDYGWSAGLTGKNVRVGVVDSGLYYQHEDLTRGRIVRGWDYRGGSPDTRDEMGHGTFAAGIIASQIGNGLGVAGVAPDAELVPLKCFDSGTGKVSDVVRAMIGGIDTYHCGVLNLSFGMKEASRTLREAVEYAVEKNVILVAAAGNLTNGASSTGEDPLLYPAAYEGVTGVGAVDAGKNIAGFSYQNSSVFITAPGADIVGLGHRAPDDYTVKRGTSFAAPAVTAAAALARSVDPSLTGTEFQRLLRESAEDLGEPGYDTVYGYGLLNVERLLLLLQNESDPKTVYGYVKGLKAGKPATAVMAAYDEDRRMMGIRTEALRADEDGTALIAEAFPEKAGAAGVRLIILGENFVPVCKSVAVK